MHKGQAFVACLPAQQTPFVARSALSSYSSQLSSSALACCAAYMLRCPDLLVLPAGRQVYAQEPIFVPRPGAQAEDEGWVLSLVFDAEEQRSSLVILDAQRLSGGRGLGWARVGGRFVWFVAAWMGVSAPLFGWLQRTPVLTDPSLTGLCRPYLLQLGQWRASGCHTGCRWGCTAAGREHTWPPPLAR